MSPDRSHNGEPESGLRVTNSTEQSVQERVWSHPSYELEEAGLLGEAPPRPIIPGLREVKPFILTYGYPAWERTNMIHGRHCSRCFTFPTHFPEAELTGLLKFSSQMMSLRLTHRV